MENKTNKIKCQHQLFQQIFPKAKIYLVKDCVGMMKYPTSNFLRTLSIGKFLRQFYFLSKSNEI